MKVTLINMHQIEIESTAWKPLARTDSFTIHNIPASNASPQLISLHAARRALSSARTFTPLRTGMFTAMLDAEASTCGGSPLGGCPFG
jgi:hypothetical protein